MVEINLSIYQDIDRFYTNYNSFKEKHKDKFIAIQNKKIVIVADTIKDLKKRVLKLNINLIDSVNKYIPKEDVTLIL